LEQSGLSDKVEQVNRTAVELAKQVVGERPVLVAGSVGPTGHLLEPLGPLSREEAVNNYSEQGQILAASGVDLIVIETQFDLAEAEAAVQGVRAVTNLPLVCSFSYDRGTRSMMGVRPAQTVEMLQKMDVSAIGINCGRSLTENGDALKQLSAATSLPIWFKPNAGLPQLDSAGNPTYSLTPDEMGGYVSDWIDAGARVIGGCCGTSPAHLQAVAQAVKSRKAIQ
jgi:5-methyltetrahydrofolate--homocysteine methyltransferase